MSLSENKELVRKYYEEMGNHRRFEVADEIFGPEMKMFPNAEPPYGPEAVKGFLSWFTSAAFSDVHVTIDDLIAEGDQVVARVSLDVTQANPINWLAGFDTIPATHKRITVTEWVIWRIEDGKIVERKLMFDPLDMLQQLGYSRFMAEDTTKAE